MINNNKLLKSIVFACYKPFCSEIFKINEYYYLFLLSFLAHSYEWHFHLVQNHSTFLEAVTLTAIRPSNKKYNYRILNILTISFQTLVREIMWLFNILKLCMYYRYCHDYTKRNLLKINYICSRLPDVISTAPVIY